MLNTPCDVQVYNCLIGIENSILTLLFHISGVVNHLCDRCCVRPGSGVPHFPMCADPTSSLPFFLLFFFFFV
jgi:hypothetical protein